MFHRKRLWFWEKESVFRWMQIFYVVLIYHTHPLQVKCLLPIIPLLKPNDWPTKRFGQMENPLHGLGISAYPCTFHLFLDANSHTYSSYGKLWEIFLEVNGFLGYLNFSFYIVSLSVCTKPIGVDHIQKVLLSHCLYLKNGTCWYYY